jgi:hypothetical protein
LGSPTTVAEALGISTATLFRWERRGDDHLKPPPARYLVRLKELILAGFFDSENRGKASGEGRKDMVEVLMRIRTVEEVTNQSQFCSAFWIFRTGRKFPIASNAKMLDDTMKFLMAKDKPILYFVFRDEKSQDEVDPQELQAKLSYDAFQRQLEKHEHGPSVKDQIRGLRILEKDDALHIGLSDPWISFAMAEYSNVGYDKYGRSMNTWLEFVFETGQSPQLEQRKVVWLELPASEALMWKQRRSEVFQRLVSAERNEATKR